jgi:hypothetical protein
MRCGIEQILLLQHHQTSDQLLSQLWLQHQVVLHQHIDELLREVLQDLRVSVGNMRDEVNQLSQRDNSSVCRGRRRGHENFAVRLILVELRAEILNV